MVDDKSNTGRIYIDATDYTEWHYIDLLNKEVVTKNVDEDAPVNWDFAIHRYDAKQMTVQLWNVQQLISVQFLTLTPFPKSHLSQMSGQRIKSQLICPK